MNREIFKTINWYKPNSEDMQICADCARGWAFYNGDSFGYYVHKPNDKTPATICRAVNDIEKIPMWRRRMLAEAA